jgi:hypothetical protein
MKKAIAVLNVGGKSVARKSYNSFKSASVRWGCDLVIIKESLASVHCFWQKTMVCGHLSGYDRVLQLDGDTVVRHDAPSPFDLVPEDHIGVVAAKQMAYDPSLGFHQKTRDAREAVKLASYRENAVWRWARLTGKRGISDDKHVNTGFMLYTPAVHKPLFDEVLEMGRSQRWLSRWLPEQASFSIVLGEGNYPVTWLPEAWNLVVPPAGRSGHLESRNCSMNGWIYHIIGRDRRQQRIAAIRWWRNAADAIASRLEDGQTFCEVGVFRGINASNVHFLRPNSPMILVDGWGESEATYTADNDILGGRPQEWHDRNYASAMRNTETVKDRTVLRGLSLEQAAKVADGSVDLVYLDADHTYKQVKADIEAWLPKVRPGGWISGHDYHTIGPADDKWGVAKAVSEVLGEPETDDGETWFWRVK